MRSSGGSESSRNPTGACVADAKGLDPLQRRRAVATLPFAELGETTLEVADLQAGALPRPVEHLGISTRTATVEGYGLGRGGACG